MVYYKSYRAGKPNELQTKATGRRPYMTDAQQREAARQFFYKWNGKGREDEDARSYWIDILQDILGADHVTDRVDFEKKVVGPDNNTKRIDVRRSDG